MTLASRSTSKCFMPLMSSASFSCRTWISPKPSCSTTVSSVTSFPCWCTRVPISVIPGSRLWSIHLFDSLPQCLDVDGHGSPADGSGCRDGSRRPTSWRDIARSLTGAWSGVAVHRIRSRSRMSGRLDGTNRGVPQGILHGTRQREHHALADLALFSPV
jgi:hypothetical protein